MGIYDYNAEEHDRVLRNESFLDGKAEGKAEGRAEGIALSIINYISLRWGISSGIKDRIFGIADIERLNEWFEYAVKAGTLEEFLESIEIK